MEERKTRKEIDVTKRYYHHYYYERRNRSWESFWQWFFRITGVLIVTVGLLRLL